MATNKVNNNLKINNNINKLAPSLNNTTTKNVINNPSLNTTLNEKLQEAKEKTQFYDIIVDNYFLLLGLSFAILVLIIIYFFSSSFRTSRCIDRMSIYQSYQTLSSLDISIFGNKKISEFQIASSYNPCHVGYQMFDYTNEQVLLATLQSGARYIDLTIFNSEYGANAYPVVSSGYKKGEWKMMATDTPLETCFQTIANNAFKIKSGSNGVPNPEDPLFIGLNLNTNNNLDCMNVIAALAVKYFNERLLDSAYSYQNNSNIGNITMANLAGRVIFFSSDGFQGSGLEEIVNYCWDNYDNNPNHNLRRYYYKDLMVTGFDNVGLIDFNQNGLSIVVPHQEGDFYSGNYNPNLALSLGCQFVSMDYSYIDTNMDFYITQFKDTSFILKDTKLRNNTYTTKPNTTTTNSTTTTQPS